MAKKGLAPVVTLPPTHIAESEAVYLQRLMRDVELAQDRLNSYGSFLAETYKLGPHDQLQRDGTIVRGETPPQKQD